MSKQAGESGVHTARKPLAGSPPTVETEREAHKVAAEA
jgi:hypothetical protein